MSDQLLPIPEIPEGLKDAARRGALVPFVGAGVSLLAGCPSWSGLADLTLRALIENGSFTYSQLDQIKHFSPRVKLSLARTLAAEKKVTIDFKKLLHPQAKREHGDGRRIYSSLFKLGNKFVTTNYDEWLDEIIAPPNPALLPSTAPPTPVPDSRMNVVYRTGEFIPSLLNQPNTVIHVHGSVLDPETMILATRDYLEHYAANDRLSTGPQKENPILTFLEFLFRQRTVLFIGYGLAGC